MKTFTIKDIKSWTPCYDPLEVLPADWSGTALDILRSRKEDISPDDRLWVVLRSEIIDDKTLRLFAVRCARSVQHLLTDPYSIAAIDVAERFANGNATEEELARARGAAREASESMKRESMMDSRLAWPVVFSSQAAGKYDKRLAAQAAGAACAAAAWAAAQDAWRMSADIQNREETSSAAQVAQLIKMLEQS